MSSEHLALLMRQLGESMRELGRFGILQHLERSQLAVHEFTAVFPIAAASDPSALAKVLRELQAAEKSAPILRNLPGLHTARWLPLTGIDPRQPSNAGVVGQTGAPAFALVFAFLCDGNVLDLLEELFERARPRLEPILEHCAGYSQAGGLEGWLKYFRSHRIRSNYLFRDSRQLDPSAPHLHPSAREIQRALHLRKRFREFVIKQQAKQPEARRSAFEHQFAAQRELSGPGQIASNDNELAPSPGLTFPLSSFERALDHEGMWIRRTAEIARTRARRDARARARAGLSPAGLRGVHAKHHGLLQARFRVCEDVPLRLRQGIFIPGREYEAWVRPSNSDMKQRADWLPDARGIAIKLAGVHGEPLFDRPIPNGLGLPDGHTQDFTLVSHPTFFTRNARDYALLRSFVDARPDGLRETLGVTASVLAFLASRPREFAIFNRTLLRWCRHPLLPVYHSLLPFLVGSSEVAKCSLQPTAATRALLEAEPSLEFLRKLAADPRDYLHATLQRSLDGLGETPLIFEFALHVAGEEPLPVEDPRIDWSKSGAQRVVVATLTIESQNATSSQRMASAEAMVITPWHALAAHRPVGSLNRARLTTYLASQEERWRANAVVSTAAAGKAPEWGGINQADQDSERVA